MADAFLKRVVAQRELEQELALVTQPPVERGVCRGCGVHLRTTDSQRFRYFCTRCGGWKADARFERDQARATKRTAAVDSLLALVDVPPTQLESAMSEEKEKLCPSCGKKLRSDNTKGVCAKCQSKRGGADHSVSRPERTGNARNGHALTKKKFRIVADALGIDGERLLEQFMEGWLAKIRGSVRPPEEEDVL